MLKYKYKEKEEKEKGEKMKRKRKPPQNKPLEAEDSTDNAENSDEEEGYNLRVFRYTPNKRTRQYGR